MKYLKNSSRQSKKKAKDDIVQDSRSDGNMCASHNPTEWNGLKFIDSNGCFLNSDKNIKLFDIADSELTANHHSTSIKSIENGYLPHITHTRSLSVIDTEAIEERNFSIVVDAVNGAASRALPTMVEALGCTVHRIYCESDGE